MAETTISLKQVEADVEKIRDQLLDKARLHHVDTFLSGDSRDHVAQHAPGLMQAESEKLYGDYLHSAMKKAIEAGRLPKDPDFFKSRLRCAIV